MESSRRVMQRPGELTEVPGSSLPSDIKRNYFSSSGNMNSCFFLKKSSINFGQRISSVQEQVQP